MALIDSSNFVGTINIPNTNREEISQRLDMFIDQYEPKLLRDLFGYELSKAFTAGIADYDSDGSNPTIDQRWLDLIEGAEYERSGRTYKYEGLPDIDARYVYWHWMEDQHTQTVGLGEVKAKAENAEQANPAVKMVRAWNDMVDMIWNLYYFMKDKTDIYPEWKSQDQAWMIKKFEKNNHWGF